MARELRSLSLFTSPDHSWIVLIVPVGADSGVSIGGMFVVAVR